MGFPTERSEATVRSTACNNYKNNTVMIIRALGLAILQVLFSVTASCAEEYHYGNFAYFDITPEVLFLNGSIEPSSVLDFRKALREHRPSKIILNSPGGSVSEGLEIAAIVNDRGLSTYIPYRSECASACAYIFFAGLPRKVDGALGVHQFTDYNESHVHSARSQMLTQGLAGTILAYLREFETPDIVSVRMLETPPYEMYWFSREEIELEGLETRSGQHSNGSASASVERVRSRPAGISRPSYDCAKAGTATEHAICGDVILGRLDAELGQTYSQIRRSMSSSSFAPIRDRQRSWMNTRNSCGQNVACIEASYRQRLADLGK